MYSDEHEAVDHDAALLRIDELESEHERLANELAQLREPRALPPPADEREHEQCHCKTCREHGVVVRQTLVALAILGLGAAILAAAAASYA
jgi:hypothetical protein